MTQYFNAVDWHLPARSGTQQTGVFVNNFNGQGTTIPFVTSVGDTNPLMPLTVGDSPTDWVEFDIPSNIYADHGNDVVALRFQGLGIITSTATEWSGFYLGGRAADFPDDTVNEWDGWAPQVQVICDAVSGERQPLTFTVPVKRGKYDLRWYNVNSAWATAAQGAFFALNLSIAGFAVKKVAGSGGGLDAAQVDAAIDAKLGALAYTTTAA